MLKIALIVVHDLLNLNIKLSQSYMISNFPNSHLLDRLQFSSQRFLRFVIFTSQFCQNWKRAYVSSSFGRSVPNSFILSFMLYRRRRSTENLKSNIQVFLYWTRVRSLSTLVTNWCFGDLTDATLADKDALPTQRLLMRLRLRLREALPLLACNLATAWHQHFDNLATDRNCLAACWS